MKRILGYLCATAVVLASGCVETSTYVKVRKDGRGVIRVRAYFDEEAVKKMAGGAASTMGNMMAETMGEAMGEMVAGMSAAVGADPENTASTKAEIRAEIAQGLQEGMKEAEMTMTAAPTRKFYDEAMARRLAGAFGPGVRFARGKEITHADGRKGFQADYVFADVDGVLVGQGLGDLIVELSMPEQGELPPVEPMIEGYRLSMMKGKKATLTVRPPPTLEEQEKIYLAQLTPQERKEYDSEMAEVAEMDAMEEEGDDHGEMPPEMAAQMEQQMLGAFKGRKDKITIAVDGEVTACNASYRSSRKPNTIVLLSIDYDKLLKNPKAKDIMMGDEDDPLDTTRKLRALKVPGVTMEDPDKTVTIAFQ
jgi:hypothetical protein